MSSSLYGTTDLYAPTSRQMGGKPDSSHAVDTTTSITPDTSFGSFKQFMDTHRSDATSDVSHPASNSSHYGKDASVTSHVRRVSQYDTGEADDRDQQSSHRERVGVSPGRGQDVRAGAGARARPGRPTMAQEEEEEEGIRSGLVLELPAAPTIAGGANTTPIDSLSTQSAAVQPEAQSATVRPQASLKYRVMSGRINYMPVIHGAAGALAADSSSASEASMQPQTSNGSSMPDLGKEKKKFGSMLKSVTRSFFKGSSKKDQKKGNNFFGLPNTSTDKMHNLGTASASATSETPPASVHSTTTTTTTTRIGLGPHSTASTTGVPSSTPLGFAGPGRRSDPNPVPPSPGRSTASGATSTSRISQNNPVNNVGTRPGAHDPIRGAQPAAHAGFTTDLSPRRKAGYPAQGHAASTHGQPVNTISTSQPRPAPTPTPVMPPADTYGQARHQSLPSTLFVGGASDRGAPSPTIPVQQLGGAVYGQFTPGPPSVVGSISIAGHISAPSTSGSVSGSLGGMHSLGALNSVSSSAVASMSGYPRLSNPNMPGRRPVGPGSNGQPPNPYRQLGPVSNTTYGQPGQPLNSYGQPGQPPNSYGQPGQTPNTYGQPGTAPSQPGPGGRVGGPFHTQRPPFPTNSVAPSMAGQLLAPRPSLANSGSVDTITTRWSDSTEAAGQTPGSPRHRSQSPWAHPSVSVPGNPLSNTGQPSPFSPTGTLSPSASNGPFSPTGPSGPFSPTGPSGPFAPTGASGPFSPTGASGPFSPTGPSGPFSPTGPSGPFSPTGPSGPFSPTGPSGPLSPTSQGSSRPSTVGHYQTLHSAHPNSMPNSTSNSSPPSPHHARHQSLMSNHSSASTAQMSPRHSSQPLGRTRRLSDTIPPGHTRQLSDTIPPGYIQDDASRPHTIPHPGAPFPSRDTYQSGQQIPHGSAHTPTRSRYSPSNSPRSQRHDPGPRNPEEVDLISNRTGNRPSHSPRQPYQAGFNTTNTLQSEASDPSTRSSPRVLPSPGRLYRPESESVGRAHNPPPSSAQLYSSSHGYNSSQVTGPSQHNQLPGGSGPAAVQPQRASSFEWRSDLVSSGTMRSLEPRGERGSAARLLQTAGVVHSDSHADKAAVSAFLSYVATTLSLPGVRPLIEGLQQLHRELDDLMLNMANFRRLFQRMLLVLALLCEVLVGRAMARVQWFRIISELQDIRIAVSAYMGQMHHGRWLAVLQHGHFQPDLLAGWWDSLSKAGMLLLEDLPDSFHAKRDWRIKLEKPGHFVDDCTSIKNAMSSLGGRENILTDNVVTSTSLVSMLNERRRYKTLDILQMQQAMWVMAAERENGPHTVISHPSLRLFWHRYFKSQRSVPWSVFWQEFPAQLREIGVDKLDWEGVEQLLESDENRRLFEAYVTPGPLEKVTPFHLDRAFPGDCCLLHACMSVCDIAHAQPLPPGFTHAAILSGILHHMQQSGHRGSLQTLYGAPGWGKSCLVHQVLLELENLTFKLPPVEGAMPARVATYCASLLDAKTADEMRGRLAAAIGCIVEGESSTSLQVCLQHLSAVGPFMLVLEDVSEAVRTEAGCEALAAVLTQVRSRAPSAHILITTSVEFQLPASLKGEYWHLEPCAMTAALDLFKHYDLVMHEAAARQLVEACRYHPLTLNLAAAAIAHGHCTPEDVLLARSDVRADAARQPGGQDWSVVKMVLDHLPQYLKNALKHLAILPQRFTAATAAQLLHNFDSMSPNVERDEFFARGILAALQSRGFLHCTPSTATYSMSPSLQVFVTKILCPHAFPDPVISAFHKSCCDLLKTSGSLYKNAHCALAVKWANSRRLDLSKFLHMLELRVLSMTVFWNAASLGLAVPVLNSLNIISESSMLSIWDTIQPNFARTLTPQHPSFVHVLLAHGDQRTAAGDTSKAIQRYRAAVQVMSIGDREPLPGVDQLLFAEALEKLGMALMEEAPGNEPVVLLRKALGIRLRLMDAMSVEVAETRIKLGAVLDVSGNNPQDAELVLTEGYNALVKAVPSGHHHIRFVDMFLKLAASYMSETQYTAAELVYGLVLEIQQEFYDANDPRLVRTLCKLAHAVRQQGREEDAKQLCERALQLQDGFYGAGSSESVQTRLKLANRIRECGHAQEAEDLYLEALRLQEQHLGENHPDMVTTLCELGDIAYGHKRRTAAEQYYWRAAQVMDTATLPAQTAVQILKRLVAVVDPAAKPEVLEELHRRLLNMQCQAYGEVSKAVAETKLKLGRLLHEHDKSKEAVEFTNSAIDTLIHLEGDTWQVATARKALATQLCAINLYHDAEEELCKAVNIEFQLCEIDGEDKMCLSEGLLKLAQVLKLQGKLSQAEEAIEWLVEIHKQGPAATTTGCSIGLARVLMNLTAVREQQGKLEQAFESLQEALQIFEALRQAPAGWRREDLLVRVGELAHKIGRYQQAEQYYHGAMKLMQASGSAPPAAVPKVLSKWAATLLSQQKLKEAEQMCMTALEQQREVLGGRHPDVVPTLLVYAAAVHNQGKEQEAEKLYWEAVQILEFLSSSAHLGLLERAVAALSPILESQGRHQDIQRLHSMVQQLANRAPSPGRQRGR